MGLDDWDSTVGRGKNIPLRYRIQTGSGASQATFQWSLEAVLQG